MWRLFRMQRFESLVKGLTFKGLGVVQAPNGQVFFVRGAWPGDEGTFEIEKIEKNYGYAKLVELTKKSSARREPPCPHMGFEDGKCGGCPWMIANYDSQLVEKNRLVSHLLERAGVLTDKSQVLPIIGSDKEFSYRNRAQIKTDGKNIGFVSSQSKSLAPIEDCLILSEKNKSTLATIRSQLPNIAWVPQGTWSWNFIDIDEDDVEFGLNQRRPFKQANDDQNFKMKEWLKDKVSQLDQDQSVLELFCGSGNFTEVLSQAGFSKIVATELSSEAVQELSDKKFPNVEAYREDIFKPHAWSKLKLKVSPSVLFLDPPREGFPQIKDFINEFKSIEHIIYVSCDLSTFVNDVKKLRGAGYELVEIQPLDQFPQTPHIEILSYLRKLELCNERG